MECSSHRTFLYENILMKPGRQPLRGDPPLCGQWVHVGILTPTDIVGCGVVVNIGRSHRPARGSIPRIRVFSLLFGILFMPHLTLFL